MAAKEYFEKDKERKEKMMGGMDHVGEERNAGSKSNDEFAYVSAILKCCFVEKYRSMVNLVGETPTFTVVCYID